MTLDQAERDRIISDLQTSLCVEASAGTGKTTLMVDRVISQVLQGVAISHIVAITFTEKAAGELKQRVRAELEKKRRVLPDASGLLTRALSALDTAQISTIHGFAASILRERPVEARVDPNFAQLDELGQALLADEVWERWLDSVLTGGGEALKAALAAGVTLEQMRSLFVSLYEQREYADGLPQPVCSLRETAQQVQRWMSEAESLLESCIRPDQDAGFRQWSAALGSYRSVVLPDHPLTLVKFLKGLQLRTALGRRDHWKPGCCDRQKEVAVELRRVRQQMYASLLAALLRLLREAVDAMEEEKARRNALDFDDLLLKARDLLLEDRETRRYFQEQFRFILVDEFQDTDPLQVEIVFLLCEENAGAGRWDQVRLKPGKLCIVGDPKQSIYRFRRADIETYMQAQEIVAAQGAIVPVRQNFRAAKPLIDWVNQTFWRLIRPEENYQPDYQFLLTAQRAPQAEPPRITFIYPAGEVSGMEACRRMEADALVSLLRRIRAQRWPVRTREGGQRDPTWGDIAVLFNTLTSSHLYESRLRAAEIPYRLDGGKQFFTRQEIHALAACLKAIDDPTDQIALVAALRSLFFGFSDEELFSLRQGWGPFSYFKTAPPAGRAGAAEAPQVKPDAGRALALLCSLHAQRNQVSFAYTLERLYRETSALEKHRLVWNGSQAVSNLQKAVARARAFEAAGPTTFRRFVRWLGQLEREERQEPESVLVEADEDAVELMSIHKSKGLEFPIVILANLSSGRSDALAVVADRQSRSLEFRLAGEEGIKTAGFDAIREKEDRRMEAEQKRLLYVGATRARDHLVISTFHSDKGPRGLLKHLWPLLPAASAIPEGEEETQIPFPLEETVPSAGPSGFPSPSAAGARPELEPVAVRLWRVPPPDLPADPELSTRMKLLPEGEESWQRRAEQWRSERAALFERASRSWAPASATAAEAGPVAEASFAAPRARRLYEASRLGSAFHRMMYRLPAAALASAGRAADPKTAAGEVALPVAPLVEQTALEYGLPDAAALAELIARPLPGVLREAFGRALRIHREVPFLVNMPEEFARSRRALPVLYEGFIDLILERPDGSLLIVDYKTDRITAPEIDSRMEHYRRQSRVYRAAAERASRRSVGDVWFYFVRAGAVFSEQLGLLR